MADESVLRRFIERLRRTHLQHFTVVHHHHFFSESECFHLVVSHVDERHFQLLMDLLQLTSQQPLQMGVDNRERFVQKHGRYIGSHQPTAQRNLLLRVGRQATRAALQVSGKVQQFRYLADARTYCGFLPATVAQRES